MKLICQRVGPGGNFTNHSGKLATQVYNAGINEIMGRTDRRSEKRFRNFKQASVVQHERFRSVIVPSILQEENAEYCHNNCC